jgi:hypothetical protein
VNGMSQMVVMDSLSWMRMSSDILKITPFMLLQDGRAITGPRVELRWQDGANGRLVRYESWGYWGYFVSIANPELARSRGEAYAYADLGTNGRIQVSGERFRCDERNWGLEALW